MPEIGTEIKVNTCKKCGTELTDGVSYCPVCGTKNSKLKDDSKKGLFLAIIVGLATVVLALTIILIVILVSKNKTNDDNSSSVERKIDQENADELYMQIQTCITDYETYYKHLGNCEVYWSDGIPYVSPSNSDFKNLLSYDIDNKIIVSKETGKEASVVIKYSGDSYKVTVTLGNCKSTH